MHFSIPVIWKTDPGSVRVQGNVSEILYPGEKGKGSVDMERIICLIIGYAFGLFQTGYFVGKLNHVDIRKTGSGNSGSTNALRVLGVKAGLMTFAGDVLKCVLPILLVRQIFSGSDCLPLLAMYTGAGATLGHNYPFYLKFKGGKGIAVLAGLVLSTKLWMVPIPLAAFIFVVAVTRYVSAGSLLVTIIFLAEVICFGQRGDLRWRSLMCTNYIW